MPVSISPRPLVDAARLPDLDPARHPQGDPRRQPLRHRHQRGDHRRLRDPELPLRDHAAGALRRRLLLADLPAARPHLRQLGGPLARRQGPRLPLAHHPAGDRLDHRRLRDDDAADQELLPRRDQEAVRDHRPRQGPRRAPGALRPRLPQRHADRHRRLPGDLHQRLLRRQPDHRDHLLARRPRPARLRERAPARLPGGLRHALRLRPARASSSGSSATSPTSGSIPASTSRAARPDAPSTSLPLQRRRLANFKANRRAFWSLWIFLACFVVTLCAEFVANDRPLLVRFQGQLLHSGAALLLRGRLRRRVPDRGGVPRARGALPDRDRRRRGLPRRPRRHLSRKR